MPADDTFRCGACGHANRPGARFCDACGAEVRGAGVGERVSLSNTPYPTPDTQGERRQLTVLFCDLVGSTPLSQQRDAEEWRDLLAQYQQAAAAVARFGGHLAKHLGDGLLIYFGWPTAREDDPERAVRAGLAIVDAVPLGATLAAGDGTRLAVRIGLHTGPVVIADGGEVFGETANIAARVQGAAAPDMVMIIAATQRLVAGLFVVEDRGPQRLKGVREPVTLYRVVQPSGVRSRLDVADRRADAGGAVGRPGRLSSAGLGPSSHPRRAPAAPGGRAAGYRLRDPAGGWKGHRTLAMTLRYAHLSPHAPARHGAAPGHGYGGRTGTKPEPDRARREATNRQVREIVRAGDRGRTGDLVLGKHTL